MSEKQETELKDKIYEFLIECIGGYWIKTSGSIFQHRGIPDIIGAPPSGVFCGFEIKTKTGKLSRLQEINLEEINKTKGFGIVIDQFGNDEKKALKILLS